jgi:hypothetical protein
MKKPALIVLAALAALAMPASGIAQDVEAGVSQGVNAEGVIELTPDYLANLIASSPASSEHIDQLANAESVTVINVGSMLSGAPQDAGGGITLEAAIEAGAPGLEDLRPKLEANEFVVAALEAEGLTSADVVALSVEAVGSLTVYVNTGADQSAAVTPPAGAIVSPEQPVAPAADQQAGAGADLQAGADITADQAVGPEAGQQAGAGITADQAVGGEAGQQEGAGVNLQAGADITADQAVGPEAEQQADAGAAAEAAAVVVNPNLPALYTAEQAEEGATAFAQSCGGCHGEDMIAIFQTYPTAKAYYDFISVSMPADQPGTLSPRRYLSIIAWLMQQSGFPAGDTPLTDSTGVLNQVIPTEAAAQ